MVEKVGDAENRRTDFFLLCVCVCTHVRVHVYICSGTCALSQSVSCSDTEIYLATVGRRQENQNRGG